MKYVEELSAGDCFEFNNNKFLLTHDFKKNGQRLGYSLTDGSCQWFDSNCMINSFSIYGLDDNNNFYPLKEMPSPNNVLNSSQNIS